MLPDLSWMDLIHHLRGLMNSPYIQFFFWLMWLDICTGYLKAFKLKKFDSKTGTFGLLRHILVFSTILVVAMYARALGVRPVGIAWCSFFIFNYLGSVMENWEAMGLPFPDWLRPYINQMKKDNAKTINALLHNKVVIESDDKKD